MVKRLGRKPIILKRLLSLMAQGDYLNVNVVLGLREWRECLKKGEFGASVKAKERAISRAEVMMRGLESPRRLAEGWVNRDGSVSENSEAGLRARLSDEMAFCLRRSGVLLPSGEVGQDVPKLVEQVIYELKPKLKDEVQRELARSPEGQQPAIIEGNFTRVA